MDTPGALERQVHRIHELLEHSEADVTWNDHIPDPDNPSQPRQIDVTIRWKGKLTVIECRLSRVRQNVKWIEELIGRRQSLGADTIMGVASAGFTIGAQRKAARYGVLVRDLRQLTDCEINAWGRQVALTLYYYQYSDLTLSLGFTPGGISRVDATLLNTQLGSHPLLQSAFGAAAQQLDTLSLLPRGDSQTVSFGVRIRPEAMQPSSCPIVEIFLEGKARLVAQPIISPAVFVYGWPSQRVTERDARVERFALGETSVVHQEDRIAVEIDLSALQLPPFSQIRFFRVTGEDDVEHESFALIGPEKLWVTGNDLKVTTYEVV